MGRGRADTRSWCTQRISALSLETGIAPSHFVIDRDNSTYGDAICVGSIRGLDGTVYFDGQIDGASLNDSIGGGTLRIDTIPEPPL